MRSAQEPVYLTASDLVGHLNCRYLTALDLAAARGELAKPAVWDPVLEVLAQRGALHERAFVDHLRSQDVEAVSIDGLGVDALAVEKTTAAMKAGASVIVQAALQSGRWSGRADVLRRVETPSMFGGWSYEATDTKLAKETKGGTVLQLSLYADLLSAVQGVPPEFCHVVTPENGYGPETYRTADFAAYYRRVRASLERSVDDGMAADLYPEPNPHCDVCRWRQHCEDRRRRDDHLSLVAGISKTQMGELQGRNVATVEQLADVALPWPWKPDRGASQSYEKIREQARIQVLGRKRGEVLGPQNPTTDRTPVAPLRRRIAGLGRPSAKSGREVGRVCESSGARDPARARDKRIATNK